MSNIRKVSQTEATITSVEFVFQMPNDVTRKGAVCLNIEKSEGTKIRLIYDLMEVKAKFNSSFYMKWTDKEPVKDGFAQFYDLLTFLGVQQPKELEGISLILLEKGDDFVLTRKDSQPEPRKKVEWWSERYRAIFRATPAQAVKMI